MPPPEWRDVARTGSELVDAATGRWLRPDDLAASLVVFVHGFTSHGRYLTDLASYIANERTTAALFNYDSHRGIDHAAAELGSRLAALGTALDSRPVVLVGHSMGGLVIWQLVGTADARLTRNLRGIALLGVPHNGFSASPVVMSLALDWADALTGVNPFARLPACRAVQQMTGADGDEVLIRVLEQIVVAAPEFRILSVSGGLAYLEFGRSALLNAVKNRLLQQYLDSTPNDGLVVESSACLAVEGLPFNRHRNDYAGYADTNHTFLTRRQEIAEMLARWLDDAIG